MTSAILNESFKNAYKSRSFLHLRLMYFYVQPCIIVHVPLLGPCDVRRFLHHNTETCDTRSPCVCIPKWCTHSSRWSSSNDRHRLRSLLISLIQLDSMRDVSARRRLSPIATINRGMAWRKQYFLSLNSWIAVCALLARRIIYHVVDDADYYINEEWYRSSWMNINTHILRFSEHANVASRWIMRYDNDVFVV